MDSRPPWMLQIENDLKHKLKAARVLAAARRGSLPELMVLSGLWLKSTDTIQPEESFDAFLLHLRQNDVPTTSAGGAEETYTSSSTPASRAYHSLMGVARADAQLEECQSLASRMLDAWPAIYAWSLYFLKTCVEALDRSDLRRKTTLYLLSTAWHAISTHDPLRPVIVDTPRTLEIATQLWIEEEDAKDAMQTNTPFGTCLLYSLLANASLESLQRVNKAAGEQPLLVAERAISNTRNALKEADIDRSYLAIHVELIGRLSAFEYPFRHALFSKHVIWFITSTLVKFGRAMNSKNDATLVSPMASCFGYLYNYLESTDGFTWVSQAIRAGLLQAFCDCSPKFDVVTEEERDIILKIFTTILPQYLVYRSVLESMDHFLKKVDRDPHRRRVTNSIAKQTWYDFRRLAEERIAITYQVQKDMRLVCDNIKCQKLGSKEDMRACAACMHAFYCSKECQAAAWKEGDHKTACKVHQQQRLEGKPKTISNKDLKFINALTIRDALTHLPYLRSLVERDYPGFAYHDLVIKVDYTVHPPTCELAPLTGYVRAPNTDTASVKATHDAIFEKVQENREKYALFETFVASGESKTSVLVVGTANLWASH